MRAVALLGVLVAFATLASAGQSCSWVYQPLAEFGDYYVAVDICPPDVCVFSAWIYEETNGIADLQRDDMFLDWDCGVPADTIVHAFWQTAP